MGGGIRHRVSFSFFFFFGFQPSNQADVPPGVFSEARDVSSGGTSCPDLQPSCLFSTCFFFVFPSHFLTILSFVRGAISPQTQRPQLAWHGMTPYNAIISLIWERTRVTNSPISISGNNFLENSIVISRC